MSVSNRVLVKRLTDPRCLLLAAALLLSATTTLAQDAATPASDAVPVIDTLSLDMSLEQIELLAAPLTADQLAEQTASLQSELQAGMSHIASMKVKALEIGEGPEAEALRARIIDLSEQRGPAIDPATWLDSDDFILLTAS